MERKENWTPGPWRVGPYYRHEVVSDEGVICCAPIETKQTRINAQLIAAAPDLYEALEEIASMIKGTLPITAKIRKIAEAAMAKARGETR